MLESSKFFKKERNEEFMRKTIKSILLIMTLCVAIVASPLTIEKAEAASVTDNSVYWLTGYSRSYCTFSANIYMIRRSMIARGSQRWADVTYKSAGSSLCASVPSMKWNYTYQADGMKFVGTHISLTGSASEKAAKLRSLLDSHPEGVVVRGNKLANTGPHGALLTGYYGKGNHDFYVADSTHNVSKYVSSPKGIETWSASTLNNMANAQDVWYLKSVSGNAASARNVFITQGGKTFYIDSNGQRVKGWQTIAGKKYYFDLSDGHRLYGRIIVDGVAYYLDPETGVLNENAEEDGTTTYCFGADRYATALRAADSLRYELGGGEFENIVVASGDNYPDALTGGYLAGQRKAPILLVNSANETKVRNYITTNLAEGGTVYILGGTSAVSSRFEKNFEESDYSVKRLSGKDRYATNMAILNEVGISSDEILISNGASYADSLSASASNRPILLVGSSLTKDQKEYIKNYDKAYIIGGTGAVNEKVEMQVQDIFAEKLVAKGDFAEEVKAPANEANESSDAEVSGEAVDVAESMDNLVTAPDEKSDEVQVVTPEEDIRVKAAACVVRLSGSTRYETSIEVAKEFATDHNGTMVVVYGQNYPDGLSSGPLAIAMNAPIVLATSKVTAPAKNYASEAGLTNTFVVGGPMLVSVRAATGIVSK